MRALGLRGRLAPRVYQKVPSEEARVARESPRRRSTAPPDRQPLCIARGGRPFPSTSGSVDLRGIAHGMRRDNDLCRSTAAQIVSPHDDAPSSRSTAVFGTAPGRRAATTPRVHRSDQCGIGHDGEVGQNEARVL